MKKFNRVLVGFLVFDVLVILWGAFVRISFSGDGCGTSWPLCEGRMIPSETTHSQWIEWTHRLSTGIFGLCAVGLFIAARCYYPKKHPVRRTLTTTLILTIVEALIGAALVKFQLVGTNTTVIRAWIMGIHQLSSLSLTGAIFLSVLYSSPTHTFSLRPDRFLKIVFVFFGFICFTGALASLAGTLFPSISLLSSFLADFQSTSHLLVRLRVSHPIMATLFFITCCAWLTKTPSEWDKKSTQHLFKVLGFSFAFGWATLLLLSPIWMRLSHLALAHVLCITLIYASHESN